MKVPVVSKTLASTSSPWTFPLKKGWAGKGLGLGFSRPTHFLREKPWGRGCLNG